MTTPNTLIAEPATNAANEISSATASMHSVEPLLKGKEMSNAELQDRISKLGIGEEDISDELEDEGHSDDQPLGDTHSASDEGGQAGDASGYPEGLATGEESGYRNTAALGRSNNGTSISKKSTKAVKKHFWNLWFSFQLPELISHPSRVPAISNLVILALLVTNIISGVLFLTVRHGSDPTGPTGPSCDCTTGVIGSITPLLTTSNGWPIRTFSSHPEADLTSLRYLLTLMPTTHLTPDRHQSLSQLLVEAEQAVPRSANISILEEDTISTSSQGKIYTLPKALPTGVGGDCQVEDELCRVRDLYLPQGIEGVDWESEEAEKWVEEWNSIVRNCVSGLIGRLRARARQAEEKSHRGR